MADVTAIQMIGRLASWRDLLLILVLYGLFSTLSPLPLLAHAAFLLLCAAFLLPGLALFDLFGFKREIRTLPISFLFSYSLYCIVAQLCELFGLTFSYFVFLFSIVTGVLLLIWFQTNPDVLWRRPSSYSVYFILLLTVPIFYFFTALNDLELFLFSFGHAYETASFTPQAIDSNIFGLSESQPRFRSNYLHALLAFAAWLVGVQPDAVARHLALPVLGIVALLSVTALASEVLPRRVRPSIILISILVPLTLLYELPSAYHYEFRVLNGFTLDKDFLLFVLLPPALLLSLLFIRRRSPVLLIPVAAACFALLMTHPTGPTFFIVCMTPLLAAALTRESWGRCGIVFLAACVAFLFGQITIDASSTHLYIQRLVEFDFAEHMKTFDGSEFRSFWRGHYYLPGNSRSTVEFLDPQGPRLRYHRLLDTPAVVLSVWSTLFLCLATLLRKWPRLWHSEALTETPRLYAIVGAILSAGLLYSPIGRALPWPDWALATLTAMVVLTGLGLTLLTLHRNRQGAQPDLFTLRLCVYLLLTLIFVLATTNLLLGPYLHLVRGLERLNWFYFVYLTIPVALAGSLVIDLSAAVLAWISRGSLRLGRNPAWVTVKTGVRRQVWARRLSIALTACFLMILFDQFVAGMRQEPSLLGQAGLVQSYTDVKGLKRTPIARAYLKNCIEEKSWQCTEIETKPQWLCPQDRVLVADRLRAFPYQVGKQLVYYPELYSEAFAYEHLGDAFLADFTAYHKITHRHYDLDVKRFLVDKGVTVIIIGSRKPHEDYLGLVAENLGIELNRIQRAIYRLGAEPCTPSRPVQ